MKHPRNIESYLSVSVKWLRGIDQYKYNTSISEKRLTIGHQNTYGYGSNAFAYNFETNVGMKPKVTDC